MAAKPGTYGNNEVRNRKNNNAYPGEKGGMSPAKKRKITMLPVFCSSITLRDMS